VVKILTRITSSAVIHHLRAIFLSMGLPKILTTDNARNFTSQEFKDFLSDFNIRLMHTTPYWPQANGEVERQNRSLLKILKIAELDKSDWKKALDEYLYMYSLTPHSSTGKTPSELAFGRNFRDYIPEITDRTTQIDLFHDRDLESKFQNKQRRDVYAKPANLNIDDNVFMKNMLPGNKLAPTFVDNPAKVVDIQGSSVTVQTPDGRTYKRNSAHLTKVPELANESAIETDKPTATVTGNQQPQAPLVTRRQSTRQTKLPIKFSDYKM
jgi:hypothetical protein